MALSTSLLMDNQAKGCASQGIMRGQGMPLQGWLMLTFIAHGSAYDDDSCRLMSCDIMISQIYRQ